MGNLEQQLKKEIRGTKIQQAILKTIALAGVLSVALLAPKMLKIIGRKHSRSRWQSVSNSKKRLIEAGLIEYSDGYLRLTDKGEGKLKDLEVREYNVIKPQKWDGKWRVLIFDIKEERKVLRDKIRRTLIQIGFVRLQDSVWIYPYDCEDLITLLKADFRVGKDVLYMIVDKLENDSYVRNLFSL
jgi:CRISPR-associated endonuclease Cas2